MTSKLRTFAFVAGLVLTLSVSAFASKKGGSKHLAVGTITSIDANQVVVSEKVKGKDQPMTFKMDSSTQKSGNLQNGTLVTIQYVTQNNENVATSVRERAGDPTASPSTKTNK
jgi:hypothetical protein